MSATFRSLLLTVLVVASCGRKEQSVDTTPVGDSDAAGYQMVAIPAGSFMMGCNAVVDTQCEADESPYHSVQLSGFSIDKTEVTQAAFQKCVANGICVAPDNSVTGCNWDPQTRADFPVVCVSFVQATAYCESSSRRLPTEAEWERAARGTEGRVYPWGNELPTCERAQSSECGTDVVRVASLASGATPDGIVDMAGNAAEWVSDWYDAAYYQSSPSQDPSGPATGVGRVIRGGSFFYDATYVRASNRGAQEPAAPRFSLGFRCAKAGTP